MSRRKKKSFAPWLSAEKNFRDRQFIQLTLSMLTHPAYHSLSGAAVRVYHAMLLEARGKPNFRFPEQAFSRYGLPRNTARNGIKCLIDAGFIEVIEQNWTLRKPNLYAFSTKWYARGQNISAPPKPVSPATQKEERS